MCTRNSSGRLCIFIAYSPTICKCKLQLCDNLSLIESESYATCETVNHTWYARSALYYLEYNLDSPITIIEDNAATIADTSNKCATK